ncbi:MAG: hypothetical protein WA982_08515 [Rubrobacteraceae bacterium]
MNRGVAEDPTDDRQVSFLRRAARRAALGVTLIFVIGALLVSVLLVVYTAWRHDLSRGLFALLFAVLSAQIALNWLLWKEDDDDPEAHYYDPN